MKTLLLSAQIFTLAFALLFPEALRAQEAGDATKKILEAYEGGRFEETIKLANAFIQASPTSLNLPSAYLLLARSQYNLGKWPEAIVAYRKVQTITKEKDVKEESAYFILQAVAAQASAVPDKSAEQKKSIEEAIQLVAAFAKEFPESKSLAENLLLRARLHVQQSKYAEASADLDAARLADKEKYLTEDLDYLQGYAEAQRAKELLADFSRLMADS